MQSFAGDGFNNLLHYYQFKRGQSEANFQDLIRKFAPNRQFFKICSFGQQGERRERRPGLLNRLKICPKPPEPPPREPNRLEILLRRVHTEGVIAAREICSAAVASLTSVAATQPFDVLKVEFLGKLKQRDEPWYKAYKGRLIDEIRLLASTNGWRRFYRGHLEAQREGIFQTISMFYTYQRVYLELEKFQDVFVAYPGLCVFFSGFLSASISVLLLRPYVTFRDEIMQKRELLKKYGPICAAYSLRHKIKWYQAFRGCFADFMYTGTQYGLRFLTYSKISDEILARKPDITSEVDDYYRSDNSTNSEFEQKKPEKTLSTYEALSAGALSGLISDLATHPMDVVNSRLKMKTLSRHRFLFDETCHRYLQCLRLIWKKHKLRGFYPGFVPMILKSSISTAVTFAVYDAVHLWLKLFVLS